MIEEIRIDCLHQSAEELEKAKELRQDIFRLNHTLPHGRISKTAA